MGYNIKTKGFTIVELLIVIIVIAILATISIVAYNGVQSRADTSARYSEMVSWEKVFKAYQAANGGWPPSMTLNTYYCLGSGFPVGAGAVPRCRDYNSTTTGYLESDNVTLMSELKTISSLPTSTKKLVGITVGPYIRTLSTGVVEIYHLFPAASGGCPQKTTQTFSNASGYWCQISLSAS